MRTLALALGLFVVLVAGNASAQHANPPGLRILDRIARNHFDLGNEYFQVSRYEDAAREFQSAYDITHQDELLFNIARAKESAGDIRGALDAYERFEHAGAPGFDRDVLHQRMDVLRARIAAMPASSPPPNGGETASSSPGPAVTATSSAPPASAAPVAVASASPAPTTHFVYRRSGLAQYGPYAAVGVGVVAIIVGVVLGVLAEGDYSTVSNVNSGMSMDGWDANAMSAYGSAAGLGTAAWVVGSVGAAFAIAGIVGILARGPGDRVEGPGPQAFIAPTGNGGAMVGIAGTL